MTTTTPDPISNNVERVLVRNTASGFEQGIAATAGLLTCGPIGALASWGAIRGLQGKWTPWFILGVPSAIVINVVNIAALAVIGSSTGSDESSYVPPVNESTTSEYVSSSSLPSYNVATNGGSTLQQKCRELASAQSANDVGRVAQLSFQIGYYHDTPWNTEVDQDCASVGVNTAY